MSFILRDYQQKAVDDVIVQLKKGHRKILLVAPTGAGKTAISSDLVSRSYAKGLSPMFVCHRRELIHQTYKTFLKHGIEPSFIQGGKRYDPKNPVQVASINTLVKRLEKVTVPHVVFWDETQHVAASQWDKVFKEYGSAVHIGLTATPMRLDGKSLGNYYDVMVETVTTKWLMEQGHLVNYQYYAPSTVDKSKLDVRKGEFTKASLEKANFESQIVGDNIEYYKRHAMGKRNVIFARNVKQSEKIVERYNAEGIPAKHLDGKTPLAERAKAITDFENGDILVLSNVDLFGEGFDLPSIEVVSLLTVSNSTSRVIQWWGRSLRPVYAKGFDMETQQGRLDAIRHSDKKCALIFDHGSNYEAHGMPCDERKWSLDPHKMKKKQKDDDSIAIKRCTECFRPHRPALSCPFCGHTYVANGKDIKEVAGELVLVNSFEYRQAMRKEIVQVETFEDLVRIEGERKYKVGWAENQWKFKTGEDLRESLEGYQKSARARGFNKTWAYMNWKNRRNKK